MIAKKLGGKFVSYYEQKAEDLEGTKGEVFTIIHMEKKNVPIKTWEMAKNAAIRCHSEKIDTNRMVNLFRTRK
jgi:hypothetical protein